MLGEHALLTEHFPALATLRVHPLHHCQDPILALLARTQPQVRVLGCLVEGVHFLVLLAHILGQVLRVEVRFGVHDFVAALFWADHFLEHAHLVNHVVLQAGVTEGMLALGNLGELLDIVLTLTYCTYYFLHNFFFEHLSNFRHFHGWFFP